MWFCFLCFVVDIRCHHHHHRRHDHHRHDFDWFSLCVLFFVQVKAISGVCHFNMRIMRRDREVITWKHMVVRQFLDFSWNALGVSFLSHPPSICESFRGTERCWLQDIVRDVSKVSWNSLFSKHNMRTMRRNEAVLLGIYSNITLGFRRNLLESSWQQKYFNTRITRGDREVLLRSIIRNELGKFLESSWITGWTFL